MQHGPGSHVTLSQVKLDDVTGEGAIVIEGPAIDHMACANPVVRKLVGVTETALKRYVDDEIYYILSKKFLIKASSNSKKHTFLPCLKTSRLRNSRRLFP